MRQITLDQPFNQRRLGLLKYLVSYFGSPGSTGGWVEEPLMIESERLDNEFLMTESDQDLNPFAAFDTTADIYAFTYSEHGPDALRELLATVDCDRESLLRDAAELNSLGLNQAADIVKEASEDPLPASELYCPYGPDDVYNHESWQRAFQRQQMMSLSAGPTRRR